MKDTPLYRFEDGWEVRRVLDPFEWRRLTGRWPVNNRGLFGLYEANGTRRSSVDIEFIGSRVFLGHGLSILTPEGMKEPAHADVEKYWISFISETIDEDQVGSVVRSVMSYPDALLPRLHNPEVDRELEQIFEWLDAQQNILNLYKHLDKAEALARSTAERAFRGLEGIHVLEPRHPRQKGYAAIHLLGNDHVLLISGGEGGWFLKHGTNAMPILEIDDASSLEELWQRYVQIVGETEDVDMLPQSQAETWWKMHTLPGESLYDLEPYALLNTESPFIFTDEDFKVWLSAQERM